MAGVGLATNPTAQQSTEQELASDPRRLPLLGRPLLEALLDRIERLTRDQRLPRAFRAHRFRLFVAGCGLSPDCRPCVSLVGQDVVEASTLPAFAFVGDAALVEISRNFLQADAAKRLLEDLLDDRTGIWIDHQCRPLLGPILDFDPSVAERRLRAEKEPSRGGFPHSSSNLLGEVLRVELVHALDDRLHQLAGRRVVSVLGDRGNPDAATTQHRFEGDCVLPLACETGELPDQDLLERRIGQSGFIQHLAKLRAVSNSAALSLVDELAHDQVVVPFGVVPERPELGGHREVNILAI